MSISDKKVAIHWFRKGLRLHDNPGLIHACKSTNKVYPVFCIDPHFAKPDIVGVNRYNFLLETLDDLDKNLRTLGSRLFILRGKPEDMLSKFAINWGVSLITYEKDIEPYARIRDAKIDEIMAKLNIDVKSFCSHTIHDVEEYLNAANGCKPNSYGSFCKIFQKLGKPRPSFESPKTAQLGEFSENELLDNLFDVPTLREMGYFESPTSQFKGGETEALCRLKNLVIDRPSWVRSFEKPNTSPNSLSPSTTVLSPYLKFGSLSSTMFFHALDEACRNARHSEPPVSLHGQLLWREFFYFSAAVTPNFDKMKNNTACRNIHWERDPNKIRAWRESQTGFPFIDAIMAQLRQEGWIHHLARHSVACFLTRGDLWQHWEEGVKVFDLYLLDDDWALNNANWQWLSCSNFFYQYFRCYSPIAFGKKTDKNGDYIRKWIPQLRYFPEKYIYEPWKAPRELQRQWGCLIGVDYPSPIVDHEVVSKHNMNRMKWAYANQKKAAEWNEMTEDLLTEAENYASSQSSSKGIVKANEKAISKKRKVSSTNETDTENKKATRTQKIDAFFKK